MPEKRWAMRGNISGELLSLGGKIIVHDSREELLWGMDPSGVTIMECPVSIRNEETLELIFHPQVVNQPWAKKRLAERLKKENISCER